MWRRFRDAFTAYILQIWDRMFAQRPLAVADIDIERGPSPEVEPEAVEGEEELPEEEEEFQQGEEELPEEVFYDVPEVPGGHVSDDESEVDFDSDKEKKAARLYRYIAVNKVEIGPNASSRDVDVVADRIAGLLDIAFNSIQTGQCDVSKIGVRGQGQLEVVRNDSQEWETSFSEALSLQLHQNTKELSQLYSKLMRQDERGQRFVEFFDGWVGIFARGDMTEFNPNDLHLYGCQVAMFRATKNQHV